MVTVKTSPLMLEEILAEESATSPSGKGCKVGRWILGVEPATGRRLKELMADPLQAHSVLRRVVGRLGLEVTDTGVRNHRKTAMGRDTGCSCKKAGLL